MSFAVFNVIENEETKIFSSFEFYASSRRRNIPRANKVP